MIIILIKKNFCIFQNFKPMNYFKKKDDWLISNIHLYDQILRKIIKYYYFRNILLHESYLDMFFKKINKKKN